MLGELIEENNGLIWSIVKRFSGRGYEVDDLYQIGAIGFIKSIKRFDASYEVQLSTYAVPYILGEIKRFIRDDGSIKVSRSLKELSYKIKDIRARHLRETGEEITIDKIAKELKISKEEVATAIESSTAPISIYENAFQNEEGGLSFVDKLSTNVDEAELIVNKITLKRAIETLNQREKQIILLRYYKNKTQSQVAKILGVSQVQISRLEKKILNDMKMVI